MNCMSDTGASQSIVSADIARDANLCIRPTITELRNASNGYHEPCEGGGRGHVH